MELLKIAVALSGAFFFENCDPFRTVVKLLINSAVYSQGGLHIFWRIVRIDRTICGGGLSARETGASAR
ncbi:MAG TPA: hypothetical protein V6C72_00980, partial [Chroococcales cyanobacterium]